MTHKIKVQMFGNFRMDYNGAPFVAEKMHKESQFNRMMQALIHYSDCGIAKDKLEEIVIGERDIDAPHTALRVIVYKTKQKLAQLGLPGKNLVYLEGGIYYWTPDIEIEEDAAEFEKDSICHDAALSECADRQELYACYHERVSGIARWCRDGRGLQFHGS